MTGIDDDDDVEETDCCGNGCANCVLNIDMKKLKTVDMTGKVNILSKYSDFQLVDKRLHSSKVDNVWELHFKSRECVRSTYVLVVNPGFHIMMRRPCDKDQLVGIEYDDAERNESNEMKRKYLLRPYSPYWCDVEEMEFKLLINLKPQGPMSNFIRRLQTDDVVEFRGPIGSFEYTPDTKGQQWLLIITQGVAIAPAISIVENVLHNEEDSTRILHLACFQDIEHIYFREKLYDLQKYWNFKGHIYLSHEMCAAQECVTYKGCLPTCRIFRDNLKYKETVLPFRLNAQELDKLVEPLIQFKDTVITTIAGTNNFQNQFKDLIINQGYGFKKNHIHLL